MIKITSKMGIGISSDALTSGQTRHYSVASLTPDRRGPEQFKPWLKKMTIW
jgi:hypothetical protein